MPIVMPTTVTITGTTRDAIPVAVSVIVLRSIVPIHVGSVELPPVARTTGTINSVIIIYLFLIIV
jgi:hypothetical protein